MSVNLTLIASLCIFIQCEVFCWFTRTFSIDTIFAANLFASSLWFLVAWMDWNRTWAINCLYLLSIKYCYWVCISNCSTVNSRKRWIYLIANLLSLHVFPSSVNSRPSSQLHLAFSPSLAHLSEHPPLSGLSHGWTFSQDFPSAPSL